MPFENLSILKMPSNSQILLTSANSRLVTFDRTEASKCEELKRRRELVEEAENWEDWDEWEEEEEKEEEENRRWEEVVEVED